MRYQRFSGNMCTTCSVHLALAWAALAVPPTELKELIRCNGIEPDLHAMQQHLPAEEIISYSSSDIPSRCVNVTAEGCSCLTQLCRWHSCLPDAHACVALAMRSWCGSFARAAAAASMCKRHPPHRLWHPSLHLILPLPRHLLPWRLALQAPLLSLPG